MQYTPGQQEAISYRGGDVLVSAAAGSGKTSVLSARIAALVQEGADIRRMLVVTFTSKAAGEMRSRIRRGLAEQAVTKGDPRLAVQAEQTDSADICTIHSFAGKVLKEQFALLGLAADVHAAGEEQMRIYRAEALEQTLDALYAEGHPGFLALRDRYSGRDDSALAEQLLKLYAYCMSRPEGTDWILQGGMPDMEAYLQVVEEQTQAGLGRLGDILNRCLPLGAEWKFPEGQLQNDAADAAMAAHLAALYTSDRQAYAAALKAAKIPNVFRKKKDEEESEGKLLLKAYKGQARSQLKELLALLPEEIQPQMEREIPYIQETVTALLEVVRRFEACYTAIKAEHRSVDYDDMLRLAYRALQDPDVAAAYSARYDYVFIDEYQDTNPLQEALLAALRPKGGRFMVGDMKQSIYRFRLTDPLIFRSKTESGSGVHVIRMNDNFRCGDGIITAVNEAMGKLMSPHVGEIAYDAGERLVQGAEACGRAEVLLTQPVAEADARVAAEQEAANIAAYIHGLLAERDEAGMPRYTQGDICLLLRNMEGYAGLYAGVLASTGLDIKVSGSADGFPAAVEMFLNLLRVIDGFTSDIALLSVMKSFMGGFADGELAYIRAGMQAESFGECLLSYAAGGDALAERCRTFLQKIEKYRIWAASMPVEELLIALKTAEDYEAHLLAMPGGEDKCKAFMEVFAKLQGWAAEQLSLYGLLTYVRRVQHMGGGLQAGKSEAAGAVRIMSVHGAKGLEFPVVIFAHMHGGFSTSDAKAPFLLHNELGISMHLIDHKARVKQTSLLRSLALYRQKKEQRSEELRVLYVAMTRAKQRLVLSGAAKDAAGWMQKLSGTAWYDLQDAGSMLEWVLAAQLQQPAMAKWRGPQHAEDPDAPDIPFALLTEEQCIKAEAEERSSHSAAEVLAQVAARPAGGFLRYAGQGMPVKIGVSTLLPHDQANLPVQGYGRREDGGAELGTLIHLYMQHLDFSMTSLPQLQALLEKLQDKHILSSKEGERIAPFLPRILAFLKSDMAGRIRASAKVRREIPFSLLLSARELGLAESEEQVMLQGIIDLAFEEDGKYIIVDYKSNQVSREGLEALADRYALQMRLYRTALERISGKEVVQCCLWFLRQEQGFAIY